MKVAGFLPKLLEKKNEAKPDTYIGGRCRTPAPWKGNEEKKWILKSDANSLEKWKNLPPNFGRLVLFCFEADFCVQIRILQHFSSSTRLSHFCTASISKFHQKICTKFRRMKHEISFSEWKMKLFRPDFDENLSEFRENFAEDAGIWWEIQTVCKKSGIFFYKIGKFPDLVKIFIFYFIFSFASLQDTGSE